MDRREDAVFQVRVGGQQYWAIEGPAWGGVETRVGIVEAGLLSQALRRFRWN